MNNILKYTESLLPVIDKNNVLEQLSTTKDNLSENLLPLINDLQTFLSDPSKPLVKENTALAKQFFKIYKGKFQENKTNPCLSLLGTFNLGLNIAIEQVNSILELVDSNMPNKLTSDSMDSKNVLLFKLSDYMAYLENTVLDTVVYISVMESRAMRDDKKEGVLVLPKFKENNVKMSITPLARLFSFIEELSFKGIDKGFSSLEKGMTITKGNSAGNSYAEKQIKSKTSSFGNMPMISGFIGNPIYHVRMVIADWQIARNEERKDYKKSVELRILHLKSLKAGDENPNLEKQIAYYEKKASKLEYQINKMEQG